MTTSKTIKPGKGEYPGTPLWGEHCFHEVREVRHVEVYQVHVTHRSQEGNKSKKGSHPSSGKRSASMPHCMATGWFSAIVRCPCSCSTLSMLPQLSYKVSYWWSKGAWHWAGTYKNKIPKFLLKPLRRFIPTCTYQNFLLYGTCFCIIYS